MAPRLGKGGKDAEVEAPAAGAGARAAPAPEQQQMAALAQHMPKELREALLKVREQVEKNCEHVGDKFAEEARKIHYGESDKRGIYGETTRRRSRGAGRRRHRVRPPALDPARQLDVRSFPHTSSGASTSPYSM